MKIKLLFLYISELTSMLSYMPRKIFRVYRWKLTARKRASKYGVSSIISFYQLNHCLQNFTIFRAFHGRYIFFWCWINSIFVWFSKSTTTSCFGAKFVSNFFTVVCIVQCWSLFLPFFCYINITLLKLNLNCWLNFVWNRINILYNNRIK